MSCGTISAACSGTASRAFNRGFIDQVPPRGARVFFFPHVLELFDPLVLRDLPHRRQYATRGRLTVQQCDAHRNEANAEGGVEILIGKDLRRHPVGDRRDLRRLRLVRIRDEGRRPMLQAPTSPFPIIVLLWASIRHASDGA